MDSDWVCLACLSGEHDRCDDLRGCECSVRLSRDGAALVLCESLTRAQTADRNDERE